MRIRIPTVVRLLVAATLSMQAGSALTASTPKTAYSFAFTFGAFGVGNGQFNVSPSVAVGPGGDVYVADLLNSRIQKFDKRANLIRAGADLEPGKDSSAHPRASPRMLPAPSM